MEIQPGDIYGVFSQFFCYQVYCQGYGIPVHGVMLAAHVHLSTVAVHTIHVLFNILTSGSKIGAIVLVHCGTEN